MLRLLLCAAMLADGAVLTREFTFRSGQFQFSTDRGYSVVLAEEMDVTDVAGAPQLPVQPVVISLPGRCHVTRVSIEATDPQTLKSGVVPLPAQRQRVLVDNASRDGFTSPDAATYESDAAYPAQAGVWTGTVVRSDSTRVQLLLYPVQYTGRQRAFALNGRVAVTIEYEQLGGSVYDQTGRGTRAETPEGDSPRFRADAKPNRGQSPRFGDVTMDYVIVTGAGYDTVFQRLADWKTQKGVTAVVRDIGWITGAYPGRDAAEKLRNYIKTLPDSGVRYVLLGGDVDVVPFRKAFAMNCEWGSMTREDSLPCDLYFADLSGDWDANGNSIFGEVDDNVDLHSDIAVGRAPVDRLVEAQAFVRKVLEYEHGTSAGYQSRGMFFAEILWQDPYTDQGVHKDRLDARSFGAGYDISKLYQSAGNESREAVMAGMRAGRNFMNHDGHGWIDVMECGGSANRMRTGDADTITNSSFGILYSIGCWTTAFDFVSIGEALVANPSGGTVAVIGNSSYGWGSPGNPGFGYSDKFDDRFWHAITREGLWRLGDALNRAKAYYAPFSHDRNVYRWHQYEVNLMGDPEMPVWTAEPRLLSVAAPSELGIGAGRVQVVVRDNDATVKGALVCLMKGDESYARGRTDDAGSVWLDVALHSAGDFRLTVSAHNYLPSEAVIPSGAGAHVAFIGWTIDDAAGNTDGVANPGESIILPVWLRNTGDPASGPATLVLRTAGPHVTITDSTAAVPALAPGESTQVADAFAVTVAAGASDGVAARFDLLAGGVTIAQPVLLVGTARLALERWWIAAPPLLPGAGGAIKARLWNSGHGWGHGAWSRLSSLDPLVTVTQDSVDWGEVQPLNYGVSADSFTLSVDASCPNPYLASMLLQTQAGHSLSVDTFALLVGQTGFTDDMESGDASWTHGGTGDMWHRTNYRAHSGGWSWYCGDDGSRQYASGMDAALTSLPLVVAENCSLSFWRWFKVPNYGVDGIRVIVRHSGIEDTLDFIGTGGALGGVIAGIESDWAQERYELPGLVPGETIQVKLAFWSDRDTVDEGFYIDDVRVTGGTPPGIGVAESPTPDVQPLTQGATIVRGVLQAGSRLTADGLRPGVGLYDANGRRVMTLRPGANDVSALAPGVYFIREVAGSSGQVEVRKVLLLR